MSDKPSMCSPELHIAPEENAENVKCGKSRGIKSNQEGHGKNISPEARMAQ